MPSNLDRIFIKDLTLLLSVGIYDHEKAQKQRVVFNVVLDVASNYGLDLSSIDDVVSYELVHKDICAMANTRHYDLLEELAEDIAAYCLSYKRVLSAHIKIEKPDIIDNVSSVGIEIIRQS